MTTSKETTTYTVLLKVPGEVPSELHTAIQAALQSIDGVSAQEPTELNTLGLNKKELLLSTLVSFPVAILANFATDAIKEALQSDPVTRELMLEDVIAEPMPGAIKPDASQCE